MILGLIEHDRGKLSPQTFEMLTLARNIAETSDAALHAIVVGMDAESITTELGKYGVKTLHRVQHDALNDYAPAAWAAAIMQLAGAERPLAILAAGTDRGNEVMAHVAARLNQPLAANVTAVLPGDDYQVTRVRWGGSLLEDAWLKGDPKLMTVAPHVVAAEETAVVNQVTIDSFAPTISDHDLRVRVVNRVQPEGDKVTLAEARIVVSGGRGVGSAEGFAVLEEVAELLGGAVGGSRVVTNLGWRPHSDQVGQTGTRVAPDLYIACGISGAIQHWVGCKGAKHVLAINTDPEAPMVTKADYAVIADLHKILPALSEAIEQAKK